MAFQAIVCSALSRCPKRFQDRLDPGLRVFLLKFSTMHILRWDCCPQSHRHGAGQKIPAFCLVHGSAGHHKPRNMWHYRSFKPFIHMLLSC